MAKRKKLNVKPSKIFGVPAITGLKEDISHALRVGKNQVDRANEFAQSVGCGTPYSKEDGKPRMGRRTKARLMKEINRRRDDLGQERFVNLDGGYGDEI